MTENVRTILVGGVETKFAAKLDEALIGVLDALRNEYVSGEEVPEGIKKGWTELTKDAQDLALQVVLTARVVERVFASKNEMAIRSLMMVVGLVVRGFEMEEFDLEDFDAGGTKH